MTPRIFSIILIFVFPLITYSQVNRTVEDEKKFKNASIAPTQAVIACEEDVNGDKRKLLKVMFDKSLKYDLPNDLALKNQEAKYYHVIRLSDGARYEVSPINVDASLNNTIVFRLDDNIDPNEEAPGFGLISNNTVKVDGEEETVSSLLKMKTSDSCKVSPNELPDPTDPPKKIDYNFDYYAKKFFNFGKAESEESPEFKVSFSLDGTKRTRRYFTVDFEASPFRIHRLGLGGAYDWERAYLKARFSNENSVDTIELGTKLTQFRVFQDDGRRIADKDSDLGQKYFAGVVFVYNPRIETDRKFKEINAVFNWTSGLPINIIPSRSNILRVKPFLGMESGYKIKTAPAENKDKWILRPLFGAEFFYIPFRQGGKDFVVFEINYIRRLFLNAEPVYVVDENGKEVLGGKSKRARDHALAKITLNVNRIFSPFIEYEYGKQPPKFLFTNSRFRFGFETNFDWNWGK